MDTTHLQVWPAHGGRSSPLKASDCQPPVAVRVLMAEDNTTFACAVLNLVSMLPGVSVVGHAMDGLEALELSQRLKPDLLLLDVAMPGLGGLAVARRMRDWPDAPQILFLSSSIGSAYQAEAKALGTAGFVGKHNFVDELLPFLENMVERATRKPPMSAFPKASSTHS